MNPLGRLTADPDSEDDESEPAEDEPGSEPASPDAKKAIQHLQSMYQELYASKDPNDFAVGWQEFAPITTSINEATQAK